MKGSLLSATIAISIVIASSVIVLNVISSTIDEGKALQSFKSAKQTMEEIDTTMSELIFEATGAKRSMEIDIDEGELIVSGSEDKIKFRLNDIDILNKLI